MTLRIRRRRRRRTNVERSAETQSRLLDATIDCLIRRGYAAMTTSMVAHRAAVSRGAFQHHFRTKDELVLAAVEHLFHRRYSEFRMAFDRLPARADRSAAAVDLLWRIIGGDSFLAWIELAVAGRSDERLGEKVRELGTRMALAIDNIFRELFPPPPAPNPFFALAPRFTFALLQGLALDRLLMEPSQVHADEVIALLKRLSAFAIQLPGGKP